MDQAQLQDDIKNLEPIDIYNKYLLTNHVWYFEERLDEENPREHFENFKFFLSKKLDIHVNNITIVGSAKTCYSLAPDNDFKKFNENSDFDLVLVSSRYFNFFWEAFLELSNKAYIKNFDQLTESIFWKFVSFKNIELNHRHRQFQEWLKKVDSLKKDIQTVYGIKEKFNFRIYESWNYVQAYHLQGIQKIKEQLKEENDG